MSYGLLKGAFRPSDETCVLRSYVRQRAQLVRDRARCVQHMHKALTQMHVQLDTVLSGVMGWWATRRILLSHHRRCETMSSNIFEL